MLKSILHFSLMIFTLFCAESFTACSSHSSKSDATILIKTMGAEKLQAEASMLKQELPPNSFIIQESLWPDSFRLLDPLQIHNEKEGFKILLVKFIGWEAGVLVVTEPHYDPIGTVSTTFDLIDDGIYWYESKE